jgi:hypothetical protein
MNFPRLFEPIGIGPKTARNRVMRPATVTNLGEGGKVGERMFAHYQEVAQGGGGVPEAIRVHPSDVGRKGTVVLRDYYSGREERIVDAAGVIWVGPPDAQGALAEALRAAGIADVRVVGDAFAPRRLANAIEDGHRGGRAV